MKKILLFDTAEGSENIGDSIIMDYCQQQLTDLFKDNLYWYDRIPTHLKIGKTAYHKNDEASYSFVCGTNILKLSIFKNRQWKIGLKDAIHLKELTLLGTGWGNNNRYYKELYSKLIFRNILSKKYIHSVRNNYTKEMLEKIGITNVLNTSCPTMWNLSAEHCMSIPCKKANEVVTALSYYNPDIERDREMFQILNKNYSQIYLWLQQVGDYDYYKSLNLKVNVNIIKPFLSEYDKLLSNHEIDYVGSRLHGGIRALNFKRRSLIIGVDNRAAEISKDTNLPYIPRDNMENVDKWVNTFAKTEIYLPQDNIKEWKAQFHNFLQ